MSFRVWLLIVLGFLVFFGSLSYVVFVLWGLVWFVFFVVGVLLCCAIFLVVLALLGSRRPVVYDRLKLPVGSGRAVEVWKECWILGTGMSYVVGSHVSKRNPPLLLADGNSIEVHNETGFDDRKTGKNYLGFEVVVRGGCRAGRHVVIICVDEGEDGIRANWNKRVKEECCWELFSLDERKFPLTSSSDFDQRLENRRLDLLEEGLDVGDTKYLDRFKSRGVEVVDGKDDNKDEDVEKVPVLVGVGKEDGDE